jgi:hypothetical protein
MALSGDSEKYKKKLENKESDKKLVEELQKQVNELIKINSELTNKYEELAESGMKEIDRLKGLNKTLRTENKKLKTQIEA